MVQDSQTSTASLSVPALGRAVAVLDLLSGADAGPMALSQMARRLGIAKSTLHGLCNSLCQLGLIQMQPDGYSLGPKSLRWSAAYLARNDIVQRFLKAVAEDPRLDTYTVTLSRLDGPEVVYLACRNAVRPLGITFEVGMRLPAPFAATGKAILAQMEPDERARRLSGDWPEAFTPLSSPSFASFQAGLAEARQRGYSVDRGEIRHGMCCVGVALQTADGGPPMGLALSMTDAEADDRGIAYVAELAKDLAGRLMGMSV